MSRGGLTELKGALVPTVGGGKRELPERVAIPTQFFSLTFSSVLRLKCNILSIRVWEHRNKFKVYHQSLPCDQPMSPI